MRSLIESLERIVEGAEEFKKFGELYRRNGSFPREPMVSYVGPKASDVKKKDNGDTSVFSGKILLHPTKWNESGIYVEATGDEVDFFNDNQEDAKNALLKYVGDNKRKLESEVRAHFFKLDKFPWILEGIFESIGEKMEDWDVEFPVKMGSIKYESATVIALPASVKVIVPLTIPVEFSATKKATIMERPFDKMSDAVLDSYIECEIGPEGIWMDGEYRGSLKKRMKELRANYRAMSPRAQVDLMQKLKGCFQQNAEIDKYLKQMKRR